MSMIKLPDGITIQDNYKLPTGISIRDFSGSTVIQIDFRYKGVRCRETLPAKFVKGNNCMIAKNCILEAEAKRNMVVGQKKLQAKSFNYADHFPDSPRVKIFHPESTAAKKILMSTLFKEQINGYEIRSTKQKSKDKIEISTLRGYKKIINNCLMGYFGNFAVQDLTPAEIKKFMMSLGGLKKQ